MPWSIVGGLQARVIILTLVHNAYLRMLNFSIPISLHTRVNLALYNIIAKRDQAKCGIWRFRIRLGHSTFTES